MFWHQCSTGNIRLRLPHQHERKWLPVKPKERKWKKKATWWWDCLRVGHKSQHSTEAKSSDADCPALPRPPSSALLWPLLASVQWLLPVSSQAFFFVGRSPIILVILLVKNVWRGKARRSFREKREFPIYPTQTTTNVQWSAPFRIKMNWFPSAALKWMSVERKR